MPASNVGNVNITCTPVTYSVGGRISGLISNTNVTLANGNDAVQFPNGAYTLPTAVAYNSSYTITLTSPTGQTCAFSPGGVGSGTVGGAAVTNANVLCTTNTYTVGGTISGLSGSANVIITNGADTINTGSNGAFTFTTPVAYQASYSVAINTQPNNQICTISNASGTQGSANVTNVGVACANSYALSGAVTNLATHGNVVVTNGADSVTVAAASPHWVFPTRLVAGATYSVAISQQPVGETCTVSQGSGTMPSSDRANVAINCNLTLSFTTNQNAALVIGQTDFVSTTSTTDNIHTNTPLGSVFLAPNGDLYMGDSEHWRIVGYHNGLPTSNGQPFDFVIGQPDFTTQVGWGTPAANNYYPRTITGNNNVLVLTDGFDSRILILHSFPETTVNADVVVGQPDFTSNGTGCTQATVNAPRDASATLNNQLLVADELNSRVLIWTTMPTVNGQNADLVLGQPDFTTCTMPAANASGPNTLSRPWGVWSDGTHVLVADTFASRVLVWNTFPTSTGQNADAVIGQPDFTSNGTGDGRVSVGGPTGVTSDGNSIFVGEFSYIRATQWSGVPWRGQTPVETAVLGEPNGYTATCNGGAGTPNINTVCQTTGITLIGTQLILSDAGNNRMLVFQSQ